MSGKTVLLTGASGFIALHITDELLRKGYKVIGTVRSQSKADKITKQFKELYPNGELSFEIVEDIAAEGAFNETLQQHPEITEVLHTASPFSFGLNKDLKEAYWVPATQGTKNILTAIKDFAPQVKHVVVTSSFAAIVDIAKLLSDKSFVHTEETWNPITWDQVKNEVDAYFASKKLAEELARNFVKEQSPNFTLTTVNPPYVLGPQKFEEALVNPTLNTSAEYVNKLLAIKPDNEEFQSQPSGLAVDVRDVAKLHVLPLENEKLAGARLFPTNGAFIGQSILDIIHKNFPELDGKVGKGKSEGVEEYLANNSAKYNVSKTKEITGIEEFIPLEKTIVDSVAQILAYKKAHN